MLAGNTRPVCRELTYARETADCRGPVSEREGVGVDDPVPGAAGVWLVQQPQPGKRDQA